MLVFRAVLLSCILTLFTMFLFGDDYMLRDKNNVALDGYDVISYFSGKPVKGSEEFQKEYADVLWYFSNKENLDKFTATPSEYLPKYHGYCAWAMNNDHLTAGKLEYWQIHDGKLYFLCSEEALEKWQNDPEGIRKQADNNWNKMLEQSLQSTQE